MTLNTKAQEAFNNPAQLKNNFELSMQILSWAHLNFELQLFLSKKQDKISKQTNEQLKKIGYEGENIFNLHNNDYKKLFERESFFSFFQTGKRIVAFALEINGLNQDRFEEIEDSITNAYLDVKRFDEENQLLEQSYQHCLDTLCVFKL